MPECPTESPECAEAFVPFPEDMVEATFLMREKRFRVLVRYAGREVWIHTNNSGSMLGLLRPGQRVLMAPGRNPKRKLPFTLLAMELPARAGPAWACVDTSVPNKMLAAAWRARAIPELAGCTAMTPEARVGASRLDGCFHGPDGPYWVEAKNVTLAEYDRAVFPDAVTERGAKHLGEVAALARQGVRAATFYLVSLPDVCCFGPAEAIDPNYAQAFAEALAAGARAWPYAALTSPEGVRLGARLPLAPEYAAAGDVNAPDGHQKQAVQKPR